jgi:Cdc6-like AAA superfamily ATPase
VFSLTKQPSVANIISFEGHIMDTEERIKHTVGAAGIFTPNAPINRKDLFAGRTAQVQSLLNAIFQRGQHAIIYGERGVGKTSLANIISDWMPALQKYNYQIVKFNCAANSAFSAMWHGIMRELSVVRTNVPLGFSAPSDDRKGAPLDQLLPDGEVSSEDVRFALQNVGSSTIIVIDEFDRVKDASVSSLLADTIKSLSDHSIDATLVVIGVADSIDDLLAEHRSIERAIVQIHMPRMSKEELLQIVDTGLTKLEMEIDGEARNRIAALSQGLPFHTHALSLYAIRAAVEDDRLRIEIRDVDAAIKEAVSSAQQTIVSAYQQAVSSPHQNLYKEVLLAAALAETDDLGYFAAGDLRHPLSKITEKDYGIDRFMKHLNEFCSEARGKILEKTGQRRRFRFRFKDSMMEPFVIMRGIKDGLISEEIVLDLEKEARPTVAELPLLRSARQLG